MRHLALALTTIAFVTPAAAGPYCGTDLNAGPPEGSVLPVGPTISVAAEDGYYNDERQSRAKAPKISATIGGKAVRTTVTDVRTLDGVIRRIRIHSRRTGKLVIKTNVRWDSGRSAVKYTIAKTWQAPVSPQATIRRDHDTRLEPYHQLGDILVVSTPTPVALFDIRWRRDADDQWHSLLATPRVSYETKENEAWLGDVMCGAVNNFPISLVENGIEMDVHAVLPDGTTVELAGLPNPVKLAPLPPILKRCAYGHSPPGCRQ